MEDKTRIKKIVEYGGLAIGVAIIILTVLYGSLFKLPEKTIEIKNSTPESSVSLKEAIAIPHESITVEAPVIDYKGEKVEAKNIEKLPESKIFQTFSYDSTKGKVIDLTGTCTDVYYTIVVFDARDDYKKNPTSAKINSAHECPEGGRIKESIDLSTFGIDSGEYYIFVADQGSKGSWYNPR
ncbi:MAG: hypothetical protein LiPW41_804 [Parcubacteria group bacterium LiPW_41]|nr:MAG: hypothetical protein LiPW41_804 [Parcubacteria group bacterium LiPW_41]